MAAFVVLEKGEAGNVQDVKFLRDGFHWLAFIVPTVWLLWHRLWIEAGLAFAVTLLISLMAELGGFRGYASILTFLVSLYFGLEASALHLRAMVRRGWREWGVIDAPGHADAELIYASQAEKDAVAAEADSAPAPAYHVVSPTSRPAAAIGLVPYPGR